MSIARVVFDGLISAIKSLLHGRPFTREEVAKRLDEAADDHPEELNWRTSIVDLLKLIGKDSSLSARKRLAEELGYEGVAVQDNYAAMNTWLVEKVLAELANHYIDMPGDTNTRRLP